MKSGSFVFVQDRFHNWRAFPIAKVLPNGSVSPDKIMAIRLVQSDGIERSKLRIGMTAADVPIGGIIKKEFTFKQIVGVSDNALADTERLLRFVRGYIVDTLQIDTLGKVITFDVVRDSEADKGFIQASLLRKFIGLRPR